MSFVKYQNTNNASSLLIADITASQTTILITDGDQGLFPSSFPFLLTIEHLDASENVILREIVKVVSSNQNSFTVERSAGICVQDDTATNRVQDNTAHAFYSGDKISLYWTAEQVADIQNNLELKANQEVIANLYDNTATYSVGDIVVYNGDRYICSTAVETAEEFDSTKWTKVNIQYDLDQQETRIDNIETEISQLGSPQQVDILVLGGGGGGGGGYCGNQGCYSAGGGGGAGQLKIINGIMVRDKTICVVVGSGGNGGTVGGVRGNRGANGNPSKFGNITAMGGGGGGAGVRYTCPQMICGNDGGSGGGNGGFFNTTSSYLTCAIPGGKALGGGGYGSYGNANQGGGGGGVGGSGGQLRNIYYFSNCYQFACIGHVGGKGIYTNFGGTIRCIGGGGNGGDPNNSVCVSYYNDQKAPHFYAGTNFGGGFGGRCYMNPGCPGASNTGGGGGGGGAGSGTSAGYSGACQGGKGGSGLVIVRYPTDCSYGIKTATGGTITTTTIDGIEYKVHTFTSSGTFEITESV